MNILYIAVISIVPAVISSEVNLATPAIERRMLIVPPGDAADRNTLQNNGANAQPEPRLNTEDVLTPQQLLATLHQIRQKQNEAPQRSVLAVKKQKSSNELPQVISMDYSHPLNAQIPAVTVAQQKPQGLSTTWKFLLQVIKDITTNLRPTMSKEDTQSPVAVPPPPQAIRESINNNNNAVFEEERESVTKLIGAILGRFDCRKHAVCKAGKYMGSFRGKNIVLLFLEKWAPDSWTETLRVAKSAAIYGDSCEKFYCPIPE